MPKIFSVLKYVRGYWNYGVLNIIFNILYAVFGVFSLTFIVPFLELLNANFQSLQKIAMLPFPRFSLSNLSDYITGSFNHFMVNIIFANGMSEAEVAPGKIRALIWICVTIFSVTLLKNIFRFLAMYFLAPIRIGVVRDLRNQLHKKSLELPLSYYSDEKKGDIISRITNDVMEIEFGIMSSLETIFREPLTVIILAVSLISLSPWLTLYVVLLSPLASLFITIIGKSLKRSSHKSKAILGQIFSYVDETLGGLKIIKAFSGEASMQKRFEKANEQYRKDAIVVQRKTDLSSPLTESLVVCILMVILFLGGSMVVRGEGITGPAFILYFALASQIVNPVKQMSVAYGYIQKGIASEERISRILDAPLVIENKPNAPEMGSFQRNIEFDNVSFTYHKKGDAGYVLKNIRLIIPKGKTIALVGQSGSGKTTLADMIPRFYDADQGAVKMDGIDIRELDFRSVRKHIGVVTQESVLFNDSVLNNIAFGTESATREQIIEAAKVANAHEFIIALPQGYDTNIGDRGGKLSGGQKQRLAIARAVLKDPDILILDEATSALDTESERLVQDALQKLMKSRTSVVIAHRLSTIVNADEIIVMQQGEIIERGTHADLMKLNGSYKKLCDLQNFS